ncbi:methyltransferase domain-containing protein [Curtobacterium sp. RRHDQ10]|uniref:methyltransferase domain-containing protein n=1 Tax=Curtobacterium phyllosphaerae TaxID=3413379 RepID=UPI003BF37DF3
MDEQLVAQTRAGYDAAASAYAQNLRDTSFEAGIDMAMIDHFIAQLPVAPAVLDAGCGNGRMLTYLREKVASATLSGADLSDNMLSAAKERNTDADLFQADLAALPYADDSFDGILAWYSIIHTPPHELGMIFAEFRRVLRPGGVLLVGYQTGTGQADRGARGKSNPIDAEAAARTVLRTDTAILSWPRTGQIRSTLPVLLAARRSMDGQRTANRNALTALLRTIDLGSDAWRPLTDKQIASIAAWRHHPSDDIDRLIARGGAVRLARDVIDLTGKLQANHDALRLHVSALAPSVLNIAGVGPVSAAVFLTAYSHVGRVRSEAAFASLAGAAPIAASSGNTSRHRLNGHGDRRLNSALETVARVGLSYDPDTRAYKQRRLAEGKTTREVKRMLKRYIARQIYRHLTAALTTGWTHPAQRSDQQ